MYTEIYVNVDLREDTPREVIKTLEAICNKDSESPYLVDKPLRWSYLFNSGSYYTPNTQCAKLTFDPISHQWSLLAKGDIKNYEGEIEEFFDWIKPYVKCRSEETFIGYKRYEEDCRPTNIYIDKSLVRY